MPGNCIDFSTMRLNVAAKGLIADADVLLPASAKGIIITVEGTAMRWRADGTAATTSVGHTVSAGGSLTFDSWSDPKNNWRSILKNLSMISTSSTSDLQISYFD